MIKLNNQIFIEKSNKIHNFLYNYDRTFYKNNDSMVIISCKRHGYFEQLARNHLKGHGCFKCKNNFLTDIEFKELSINIHGNKYLYDLSVFNGYNKNIKIICKTHGVFEQLAKSHLNGNGCFKCSHDIKSKEIILERLNFIHDNKYLYDDFDYNKKMSDIFLNITCKIHGKFKQRLNNHFHQRNGCPFCKKSKGEEEITRILKKYNIIFEREKKFEKCKNIRKLSFDFYLPIKNVCIEFDGVQHFRPTYGKEQLLNLKINDKIKNDFCFENNIKLIRIKYNQDIEEEIFTKL